MGVSDKGIDGERRFPPTSWSAIRGAQDPEAPDYQRSLATLVETYWKPIYCMIRRSWARTDADAKDLTQDFFATVILHRELARGVDPNLGSFRTVLKASLTRFLKNAFRDAHRDKRGGGAPVLSLDGADGAALFADAAALPADQLFDLAWRQRVIEQATARTEQSLAAEGKPDALTVWRRYDLAVERTTASYASLGAELGLTAPQVKHALLHARAVFADTVSEVVRNYVDGPEELTRELRELFGG